MAKSPILAFALSALLPGLGQIYVMGSKGIPRALVFISCLGFAAIGFIFLIGFAIFPIVWLWCAVDAMGMAKLANDGELKDTLFGV